MAAYNGVNGVPMCEHAELIEGVLRGEWGFDGIVMSDWTAARDAREVRAGRARPGHAGAGERLRGAARAGGAGRGTYRKRSST